MGNRPPSHTQNASIVYQSTQFTGCCSRVPALALQLQYASCGSGTVTLQPAQLSVAPPGYAIPPLGTGCPALHQRRNRATVTSLASNRNADTVIDAPVDPLIALYARPSPPIVNVPPGTLTTPQPRSEDTGQLRWALPPLATQVPLEHAYPLAHVLPQHGWPAAPHAVQVPLPSHACVPMQPVGCVARVTIPLARQTSEPLPHCCVPVWHALLGVHALPCEHWKHVPLVALQVYPLPHVLPQHG